MKHFFARYAQNLSGFFYIIILIICAFSVPIFFSHSHDKQQTQEKKQNQFKLGLENITPHLLKFLSPQTTKHITVVTNQTGIDQQGRKTVDVLLEKGFMVDAILTPNDQSYSAKASKDKQLLHNSQIKIPVEQLYITKKNKRTINVEKFTASSAILFDMQDVGMRHYSYVSMLTDTLEAAALAQKPIIVLDRPNLLGEGIEGPLADLPALSSSCPLTSIPTRYGMTMGELAKYVNKHFLCNMANLTVIPMHKYERTISTYELLSQLSPNIKNIGSCHGYSFLGLLGEVAPFDVGIGTDHAFQCIMLPENIKISTHQWHELRGILAYYGIESKKYRYFSARKKKFCHGLKIQIKNINNFSAFNTLFAVLNFFKKAGVQLSYSSTFDQALGTTKVRKYLTGLIDREELELEINRNIQQFFKNAVSSYMYRPLPKIIEV